VRRLLLDPQLTRQRGIFVASPPSAANPLNLRIPHEEVEYANMSTTTKAKLDHLKSLPFPAWAEDDALSDWQMELAELDGYVAGLASKAMGGENPDANMVSHHVRQLRAGLEAIDNLPVEDRDIRTACETYLVALEDLAQSLVQ
jgi:hypothetical protein